MLLDESLFDEAMYTNISSSPYDLNIMKSKMDEKSGRDWTYVKSFKFKDDAIERANRMIANGDAYVAQVYSWLDEDHGEIYFKKADDGKVIDKSVQKVDCKTHGPELRTKSDKVIIKPIKEGKEMKKCVICKCTFEGHGNNAEPVKKGVCCDACNNDVVIPFRIKQMFGRNKLTESNYGSYTETLNKIVAEYIRLFPYNNLNSPYETERAYVKGLKDEFSTLQYVQEHIADIEQDIDTIPEAQTFLSLLKEMERILDNEMPPKPAYMESAEGDQMMQDMIDDKNANFEKDKETTREVRKELAKQGIATDTAGRPVNEGMFDNSVRYKGYDIEYNFYNEGEYTVQYQGDDIWFKSMEEAQTFIDELLLSRRNEIFNAIEAMEARHDPSEREDLEELKQELEDVELLIGIENIEEDYAVLPNEDAECSCGNMTHLDGFYPCNAEGTEIEPTEEAGWNGLYVCARCGKIYRIEETNECLTEEAPTTGEETGKDALGFDTYKYGKYTIVHFPVDYNINNENVHIESYLIQSPVVLSNSNYHLPLRAENEQGEEINFNTLEDAKAWIDKYDGKFKLQVKYGDEIHAVIKDEFKQIEESLTEDVAAVSLTNEQANENNGLSTILNMLIKDEFDAIQGYNDAIVNFETEGRGDLVQVLKDIVNEENLHVGQLEVLLEQVNGAANSIDQGKAEAETQLTDTQVLESLNKKDLSAYSKALVDAYTDEEIQKLLQELRTYGRQDLYNKAMDLKQNGSDNSWKYVAKEISNIIYNEVNEDPEEGMHY